MASMHHNLGKWQGKHGAYKTDRCFNPAMYQQEIHMSFRGSHAVAVIDDVRFRTEHEAERDALERASRYLDDEIDKIMQVGSVAAVRAQAYEAEIRIREQERHSREMRERQMQIDSRMIAPMVNKAAGLLKKMDDKNLPIRAQLQAETDERLSGVKL